jgi:predicted nucleic acid-binding protein
MGAFRTDCRFYQWTSHGEAAISVVTVSELLVGVHRADTKERREKRSSFVEGIVSTVPILPITSAVGREHAKILASLLGDGISVGTHDLWIGATALQMGFGVLTANLNDFNHIPGLSVIEVQHDTF